MSDDPADFKRINTENVPISISLGKVGKHYIVDPSLEEEQCMQARITVAVNRKGNICSILKGSSSSLVDSSSALSGLNPSELSKVLQSARQIALALMQNFTSLLEGESTNKGYNDSNSIL